MEPPDDVRSAWQGVVEHWDDAARHQAFLAVVTQHTCFAWAATRYKERAGDAVADAQLERLRKAATATLLATATDRRKTEKQPYILVMVVLVGLVVMAVLGLVCTKMIRDSRQPPVTNSGP